MESSPQLYPGPRTDHISLRDRNVDIGAHCWVFLDSPPSIHWAHLGSGDFLARRYLTNILRLMGHCIDLPDNNSFNAGTIYLSYLLINWTIKEHCMLGPWYSINNISRSLLSEFVMKRQCRVRVSDGAECTEGPLASRESWPASSSSTTVPITMISLVSTSSLTSQLTATTSCTGGCFVSWLAS